MILVKKRSLFILTVLFCVIVVMGEMKFFNAVKSINIHTNMELKYEIENFIYAAIVLILVVFFFFINFIRMSNNIIKRLDKMVEISEYGRQDVTQHLDKMGRIGERIKYILYHLDSMNKMKTLKISALTHLNDILLERSGDSILLADCCGRIINCSGKFSIDAGIDKKDITGRTVNDLFTGIEFEKVYNRFENSYEKTIGSEVLLKTRNGGEKRNITFIPAMNSKDQVTNILCVVNT